MGTLILVHLAFALAFEIDQLPPKISEETPPLTACQNKTPAPGNTPMALETATGERLRLCGWPGITEVACRLLHCQMALNPQNQTVCVKRKTSTYKPKLLKSGSQSDVGTMPEAAPQGRQAKHTADDVPEWDKLSVSTYEDTLSNLKLEDKWQNGGWSSLEKWVPPRPPMRTTITSLNITAPAEQPPPPVVAPPTLGFNPDGTKNITRIPPTTDPSNPPCEKPEKRLCNTKYGVTTKVIDGETSYELRVGPDTAGHAPQFDVEHLENLTGTSRGTEKEVEFPHNFGWSSYGGNPWAAIPEYDAENQDGTALPQHPPPQVLDGAPPLKGPEVTPPPIVMDGSRRPQPTRMPAITPPGPPLIADGTGGRFVPGVVVSPPPPSPLP